MKNKTSKIKSVYTKEDFASAEGMVTSSWGPLMWTYLHIMSFNYPVEPTREQKNKYKQFISICIYLFNINEKINLDFLINENFEKDITI